MFPRQLLVALAPLVTALALVGCGHAATAAPGVRPAVAMRAAATAGNGALMFIGGGADQDDLMRTFVQLAGGDASNVVIMPVASDDPPKSGQAYVDYLAQLGLPGAHFLVPHGEPDAAAAAMLASARGLFWSGGDQSRVLAALTPAWRTAIAAAWHRGAVIAGTSAGAMVWGGTAILDGDPMATGWYGDDPKHDGIRLGTGLGLASAIVVDTHFSQRGRVPRLAYAVAHQPGAVGLGVDPETAAIVRPEGRLEVRGRGTVTVLHVPPQPKPLAAPLSLGDVRMDILAPGDALPLPETP